MGTESIAMLHSQKERRESHCCNGNAGEGCEEGPQLGSSDPHEEKRCSPDRGKEYQLDDIARAHLFTVELSRRTTGLREGKGASINPSFREQRACPERRGLQGDILQACERRYDFLLSKLERPILALGLVAEVLDLMTKGVGKRDEEPVVRLAAKIVRQPHFEARSASQEQEGNIVLAV